MKSFSFLVAFAGVTMMLAIDKADSLDTDRFIMSLPPKTKRFYFNHSCEYTKTEKKQRRSLERWTDVILRCKNLLENDISSVLCSKTCNYPCSNKKWKNVKAVPVYRARIITTHNNERLTIDFPIACKCVSAIKKTKKCRNNFLK